MIVQAVLVFVIVWWIVFFVSLPIKVEMETDPLMGCASGAPKKSYLAIKVLIAIVCASGAVGLYCYLKSAGYVDVWLESLYEMIP